MSLLSTIFPTSFDDLVFEGRNQAYGAYQLRQAYNGHVRIAMSLMVGLGALLFLGSAAWKQLHPVVVSPIIKSAPLTPITPPTYVTETPKPAAPPAAAHKPRIAAAAATSHTASNLPTQVIKDELAPTKPTVTTEVTQLSSALATTGPTTIGETDGTGLPTGTANSHVEGGSVGSTGNAPAVVGPYVVVEKMPEFMGGMDALMRYLQSYLRYPSAALREQAEGRVFVSFVVQADGTIADISVPKGLGFGLDEEAQRVVSQMPAWTPGRQSNHAVAVRFTLPITFKIQ
jgi:protein TonB